MKRRNFDDNFDSCDEFNGEFESPESPELFISNNRRRKTDADHIAVKGITTTTCQQLADLSKGMLLQQPLSVSFSVLEILMQQFWVAKPVPH